jgi:hypothetical protein
MCGCAVASARTKKPLHIASRMQRFCAGKPDARYGADQRFLAHEIWAEIRADCLPHDSYYDLFGAQPFPVMGKGNDRFHVGMGVKGDDGLRREAALLGLPWPLTPLADGEVSIPSAPATRAQKSRRRRIVRGNWHNYLFLRHFLK